LLNVIKRPTFFYLLVYLKGNKHELKAGEYLFPKGTTPVSLLTQITTGSGMIYHTFTIIAGWNFKHLRSELDKDPNLQHASALMSDVAIMQYLGHPELKPEGWFFPDTYFFVKGSSDLILLKRAFQMMQRKFYDAYKKRDANLPYQTPQDALTAASLIEKETGLDVERPIIAGVIVNRLRKNMLLQIDPTVIYAMGSRFKGVIHREDLLSKNPYNTYVHPGLPPTPIAMPSMESIEAALHPRKHNYYYFVARNYNPDGGHQFSTTLEEHYLAVASAKRKKSDNEFFNYNLIRVYFLKLVLPRIYN
ncbi:MAG: hypothetical protein ACD_60C00044G0001, partial [uncultured bacterium]